MSEAWQEKAQKELSESDPAAWTVVRLCVYPVVAEVVGCDLVVVARVCELP